MPNTIAQMGRPQSLVLPNTAAPAPGGGMGSPVASPATGIDPALMNSVMGATATGDPTSGQVPYKPGPITSTVNDLLKAAISGTGPGAAIGGLMRGQIPAATLAAFRDNQAYSDAQITEQMGAVGNRFGTDLANTLARANNSGMLNLSAEAMNNVIGAFSAIAGLGTAQSGLELQGQEGSLNRANQDFLASQSNSNNILGMLLPFLLGGF